MPKLKEFKNQIGDYLKNKNVIVTALLIYVSIHVLIIVNKTFYK